MADYNVNMKQWNGASFDNVLPLAYNAKQLGGQSLAEIKQWVQDNNLLLYTGQYIGTGTYGFKNQNGVTIPFSPILFISPYSRVRNQYGRTEGYWEQGVMVVSGTSVDNNTYNQVVLGTSSHEVFIYLDADGKTIKFYSNDDGAQQNKKDTVYHFAAIGGYDIAVQTEWVITSSGSWAVPKTGRYMLELYGGGGGTFRYMSRSGYTGGASCQHYDSISLTKGESINVAIGFGGVSDEAGGTTSFGSYSVSGGGGSDGTSAGAGAGNYGAAGKYRDDGQIDLNYGTGALSKIYGYGASQRGEAGGPGAVYLKYLGA